MRKLLIIISLALLTIISLSNSSTSNIVIEVPEFHTSKYPTKELVLECAKHYELIYPEIVVAQSILETGNYRSKGCTEHNNLFGLYDSKNKRYFRFATWQESVQAYKNMIQYKYKDGEDYYYFLKRIGYAEDPNYIEKVKNTREIHYEDI